jgi:signal transduction histidine kinase
LDDHGLQAVGGESVDERAPVFAGWQTPDVPAYARCGRMMRLKTWIVAALGLGALVVLLALSMVASSRTAQDIYAQVDRLNAHHREVEVKLRALRSDVNLSGIFVRDYLLDVSRERDPDYRRQLAQFRQSNMATVAELRAVVNRDDQITSLQTKLTDYWETLDPLFDWTPAQKIVRSAAFLRHDVVPRREAVLKIAQQIEELNNANLAEQRAEVAQRHDALKTDLARLLWRTVLFGLVVAVVVVLRLRFLEHRSAAAEMQRRELSLQVVQAQEDERKHLSRELHDHVAQVLTGLRMEIGRLERTQSASQATVTITVCKQLLDELFSTVRNLALGLRPSMLDDFGLQAALEWHVRDFMRRYATDVDLSVSGDLSTLPDKHRTCVYRIVQEALTNCARHAHAQHVRIEIAAADRELRLRVADDGVGMARTTGRIGFGLRGMEERARELGGRLTISTAERGGTLLAVTIPAPPGAAAEEGTCARLAG